MTFIVAWLLFSVFLGAVITVAWFGRDGKGGPE